MILTSLASSRRSLFGAFGALLATIVFAGMLTEQFANAQDITRKMLDHDDYDVWNTIAGWSLSKDGSWVAYSVQNGAIDGESTLHLHHTKTAREYTIDRGEGAKLTHDSRFAVYRVTPEKATLKRLRKEKKKSDELPKSRLEILSLESGTRITIENVRTFQLPDENGNWVACLREKAEQPKGLKSAASERREVYEVTEKGLQKHVPPLKLKSREAIRNPSSEVSVKRPTETKSETSQESNESSTVIGKADDDDEQHKIEGTPLILVNLETQIQRVFPSVVSFEFSKSGELLAFVTSVEKSDAGDDSTSQSEDKSRVKANDQGPSDGVHVLDLKTLRRRTIAEGAGEHKNLAFSDDGSKLAWISKTDDDGSKNASWSLYQWMTGSKKAIRIATEGDKGIPSGWWVSPNSNQRFSEDGRRLYFETAPVPPEVIEGRESEAKDRGLDHDHDEQDDEEKVKLDIWHWQDPHLQPQQLLEAEAERKRDYRAAYLAKSKEIVQLETRQVPDVEIDYRSKSDIAVANTNLRYRKMLSWDVPGFQDAYLVNLNSGERRLALEKAKWSATLSPDGRFITWFDGEQKKWFAQTTAGKDPKPVDLSRGIKFPLHDELHDRPMLPGPYGSAGWLDSDRAFLIYDRYDIWKLDPMGKAKPVCLTNGYGRKNAIRFRYQKLDPKERSIDPSKRMILEAFDRKTKASGFYSLDLSGKGKNDQQDDEEKLQSLIMLDEDLDDMKKAESGDRVVFTRSTFRRCPDLWSSTTELDKICRISDINPQQEQYSWGTAELVHWKSNAGQKLDGILLKPDGFDPSKTYPMMVYFYERNSDNLHRYYTPAAGRSIICHSFYVSRGYLVFIPDIPYRTGQPGQSAADAVLPGVQHLIKQGFVDEERIGVQGHSWGGYQTAYLVTQSDLFACAESGAPVSNMTSAYGGIRWSSGKSRMFQYERTQSRIGEDLWSAREKYVANSPLFFADRINTPLLILHNDEDGAVPWYQGIELFVALRRLEKPAWMLNYNGNPHWVMGDHNRRDFAIRMQQFFDHYLKDAPEPEWMAVGVPAVEKGVNDGLELLEPKTE